MKIEIWSDYNCPFCYIGKTTLDKALEKLGLEDVEIVNHAYQLDPKAPKVALTSTAEGLSLKYGVSLSEAKRMIDNVVSKARQSGLAFDYDRVQATNTFDAHRLAKYAQSQSKSEDIQEILYKSYFTDGLNLADHDVLVEIGEKVGLVPQDVRAMLATSAYIDTIEEDIRSAQTRQIRGVPYFLVNRKTVINGAQPLQTFIETLKMAKLEEIRKFNRE